MSYFSGRTIRPPMIDHPPDPGTTGIITIPAFAERELLNTLESLSKCIAPLGKFEVLILVNHNKSARNEDKVCNQLTYDETKAWIALNEIGHLKFFVLREFDLEDKKAGVGTARKILMDEAARRLINIHRSQIPIIGLDADCIVESNYLVEIEGYFRKFPNIHACSIHFEHRSDDLNRAGRQAIQQYEQHLRYYIKAQKAIGFPFAFQTIGSSMAVRCINYIKQGGMNRRQAGEDFYFLHKFIELGNFGELNTTTVYPSGRVSDRVPFGTGKAVGDTIRSGAEVKTYHFQSFIDLKVVFDSVHLFWSMSEQEIIEYLLNIPVSINNYLSTVDFVQSIRDIQSHTSDQTAFRKRFFRWFNAFMLMKYLHYARDHFYPDRPVSEMVKLLDEWRLAN